MTFQFPSLHKFGKLELICDIWDPVGLAWDAAESIGHVQNCTVPPA